MKNRFFDGFSVYVLKIMAVSIPVIFIGCMDVTNPGKDPFNDPFIPANQNNWNALRHFPDGSLKAWKLVFCDDSNKVGADSAWGPHYADYSLVWDAWGIDPMLTISKTAYYDNNDTLKTDSVWSLFIPDPTQTNTDSIFYNTLSRTITLPSGNIIYDPGFEGCLYIRKVLPDTLIVSDPSINFGIPSLSVFLAAPR